MNINKKIRRPRIAIHEPDQYHIIYGDCVENNTIRDNSVDLGIFDPPFGIEEKGFKKHYNRNNNLVIDGYVEAPADYYQFTKDWLSEAKRVLKPNGSMYIISGWSYSDVIGRVIRELDLVKVNKIIWNFPFGVYTKKKYVTSHYEIFYVKLSKNVKVTFNTNCRFETTTEQYADMQSVWHINKENHRGRKKNSNKLPEALVEKMIRYSSNEEDTVADFFMGNFTILSVCQKLNRKFVGIELNPEAFTEGYIKKI